MRAALWAAMAGVAALATAAAARAAVYDFVPSNGVGLSAELVISDAAVQRGSFALIGTYSNPGVAPLTGDVADLSRLEVSVFGAYIGEQARDDYTNGGHNRTPFSFGGFYDFNLAFTFDGAGDVTSSVFRTDGPGENVRLAGSGRAAFGTLIDDFGCTDRAPCSVSGAWSDPPSAVPEPPAIWLLGIGLVAFAWRRQAYFQAA